MKNFLKVVIGILFTILPIGFSFIVAFDVLQKLQKKNILGTSFKVDDWNFTLTFITIIAPVTYLGVNSIIYDLKRKRMSELTSSLLEMTKDSFYNILREISKDPNLPPEINLPFRIYKPMYSEHAALNFFYKWVSNKKPIKFVAISLDGKRLNKKTQFYVEKTKKMNFDVPQGIVGASYIKNDLIVDDNLNENSVIYNLTPGQSDKVADLRFAISYPIREYNDNITHIVTFDCKQKLTVPEDDIQFNNTIKEYILKLRKNFPHLFN